MTLKGGTLSTRARLERSATHIKIRYSLGISTSVQCFNAVLLHLHYCLLVVTAHCEDRTYFCIFYSFNSFGLYLPRIVIVVVAVTEKLKFIKLLSNVLARPVYLGDIFDSDVKKESSHTWLCPSEDDDIHVSCHISSFRDSQMLLSQQDS